MYRDHAQPAFLQRVLPTSLCNVHAAGALPIPFFRTIIHGIIQTHFDNRTAINDWKGDKAGNIVTHLC